MHDKIQSAFSQIHADTALIDRTARRLLDTARTRRGMRRKAALPKLAASLAALFVLSFGMFAYGVYAADAYVSIDINPSVSLTLNRFDRVIDAHGFNEAGRTLLSRMSLRGKPYDDAVGLILAAAQTEGYLADEAFVSMTVQAASDTREQTLTSALLRCADERLSAAPQAVEVEVFAVSAQTRSHAHGHGISPARYLALQELLAVDEDATAEAYSDCSINQIRQRVQECRDSHAEQADGGPDESGRPDGYGEHGEDNGHDEHGGHGGH